MWHKSPNVKEYQKIFYYLPRNPDDGGLGSTGAKVLVWIKSHACHTTSGFKI